MKQLNAPKVVFFKIGGTWDMVKKNGKLLGSGGLDDEALSLLEKENGSYDFNTVSKGERKLLASVENSIQDAMHKSYEIAEHLPWVPHIKSFTGTEFYSLFSGDSSHLRPAIVAPIASFLLTFLNENPNTQILGAQGTDTADLALIPLLDAFLFDTELLPVLFTGANRSHIEWNSDAPKNFSDLFQLSGAHLPSGSYWVFASHLYRASDLVKIDPGEVRRIENYSTFFAPRLTSRHTKKVIGENPLFNPESGVAVNKDYPITKITAEVLFDAMNEIDIVDLGNQNFLHEDVRKILDMEKKAVIIAAHSFGNANNVIRSAAVHAAKEGKIVLIVDKSLLGSVTERYAAGLLGANGVELNGTKKILLSGHKMNKAVARAILTRALVEKLDQLETQELIIKYCESRQLLG